MIAALAWRNIWRQPIRTALSMVGMGFAAMLLVFMLSFEFGSYDTIKTGMLRISDGFGQIQPKGYKDDPAIDKVIEEPTALMADLAGVGAVTASSARDMAFVLLARGNLSFAAAVTGIDPVQENRITVVSSYVKQGRALRAGDRDAIILGDGLARNLGVKLGDRITLLGSARDGSVAADVLRLVGIFKSNIPEMDRQVAQIPLARFNETFQMNGAVNTVALSGRTLRDITAASGRLRRIAARHGLVYLDWAQLQPAIKQGIALDLSTAMTMYATLIFVVVFIILNTLYMSVLERTREFGVLLAIGMKPRQIGRMVWMEIIFLSLVGTGIGVVLGMILTGWFQVHGISFQGLQEVYAQFGLPSRIYPHMTPFRVLFGPLVMLAAVVLLAVIPYRRVLGLKPVSAMGAGG